MTSCNHMCFHSCNGSQVSHFSTRQCSALHGKGVTRLSPHCYYSSWFRLIPRSVSNRANLGSFGTASWASHEFEGTRGKVTGNMERNVSRHHRTFMPQCPIVSHRAFALEGVQHGVGSKLKSIIDADSDGGNNASLYSHVNRNEEHHEKYVQLFESTFQW
ncbi:transposable element Tcb1 transposase [Trichonephila clavipes]|nr:transposable element Tcb1 transposase [Trichonephila clavipes]